MVYYEKITPEDLNLTYPKKMVCDEKNDITRVKPNIT